MLFDFDFALKTFWLSMRAVPVTLGITIVSFLLAVVPSYGIALCRIRGRGFCSKFCSLYVSFMRGTPIVLQILAVYSFLPSVLNVFCHRFFPSVNIFDLNPIVYAFIVFALNTSASLSEVFRSAILTVEKGQYEAALCAGLSSFSAFKDIIIPQALVSAVPNLCSLLVGLIKNTSLAFMMTVKDVTAVAKIQASYGFNYVEAYFDIFVIYIIICSVVQFCLKKIERQLALKVR